MPTCHKIKFYFFDCKYVQETPAGRELFFYYDSKVEDSMSFWKQWESSQFFGEC